MFLISKLCFTLSCMTLMTFRLPSVLGGSHKHIAQANIGEVDNYYDMKRLCKSTATLSLLVLRAS